MCEIFKVTRKKFTFMANTTTVSEDLIKTLQFPFHSNQVEVMVELLLDGDVFTVEIRDLVSSKVYSNNWKKNEAIINIEKLFLLMESKNFKLEQKNVSFIIISDNSKGVYIAVFYDGLIVLEIPQLSYKNEHTKISCISSKYDFLLANLGIPNIYITLNQ